MNITIIYASIATTTGFVHQYTFLRVWKFNSFLKKKTIDWIDLSWCPQGASMYSGQKYVSSLFNQLCRKKGSLAIGEFLRKG